MTLRGPTLAKDFETIVIDYIQLLSGSGRRAQEGRVMRTLLYLATVLVVMGLAFWAYRENYRTQAQIDGMESVQREIAGLREQLGVLRAEWAWLNRPERLAELVDLNFERLRLLPLTAEQFMEVTQVPYAPPPPPEPFGPPAPETAEDPTAAEETRP